MSSIYIINILTTFSLVLLLSCKERSISFLDEKNSDINYETINVEEFDKIDLSINEILSDYVIDFYTYEAVNYDYFSNKINKFKIKNNLPINIIYSNSFIYSLNFEGEILKFNNENGKLIDKYLIDYPIVNNEPVSFSLIGNDFVIGYKSGEIIKTNNSGIIIWTYKNSNFLNTPIKYYDNNLIILYPDKLVILSPENGKIIFEKQYLSRNIIQSSGGKIANYFNLIFFILPNSEFRLFDTFLYEEYISDINNIEITTSLNNLNDNIHVYKNLLVYLDNGNIINTYDLINNKFILSKFILNKSDSYFLFNNVFINKYQNYIEFYNIKNGKQFLKINVNKILRKDSKIVNVLMIDDKLHIFDDQGIVLALNKDYEIENNINLKIKDIKKVYSYQDKIFITSEKGITHIF